MGGVERSTAGVQRILRRHTKASHTTGSPPAKAKPQQRSSVRHPGTLTPSPQQLLRSYDLRGYDLPQLPYLLPHRQLRGEHHSSHTRLSFVARCGVDPVAVSHLHLCCLSSHNARCAMYSSAYPSADFPSTQPPPSSIPSPDQSSLNYYDNSASLYTHDAYNSANSQLNHPRSHHLPPLPLLLHLFLLLLPLRLHGQRSLTLLFQRV